eukprot:scaffold356270_cov38-Prasinocladus_malaysianus.AAC.1
MASPCVLPNIGVESGEPGAWTLDLGPAIFTSESAVAVVAHLARTGTCLGTLLNVSSLIASPLGTRTINGCL